MRNFVIYRGNGLLLPGCW